LHIDIQSDEHAQNNARIVAANEQIDGLHMGIRQLIDQIGQIINEQSYQRVCLA
jgi:hypothetical protein